jgi:hypothetical protein
MYIYTHIYDNRYSDNDNENSTYIKMVLMTVDILVEKI